MDRRGNITIARQRELRLQRQRQCQPRYIQNQGSDRSHSSASAVFDSDSGSGSEGQGQGMNQYEEKKRFQELLRRRRYNGNAQIDIGDQDVFEVKRVYKNFGQAQPYMDDESQTQSRYQTGTGARTRNMSRTTTMTYENDERGGIPIRGQPTNTEPPLNFDPRLDSTSNTSSNISNPPPHHHNYNHEHEMEMEQERQDRLYSPDPSRNLNSPVVYNRSSSFSGSLDYGFPIKEVPRELPRSVYDTSQSDGRMGWAGQGARGWGRRDSEIVERENEEIMERERYGVW